MVRVLIAGCGAVGCALGTKLAKQGHCVWGIRRDVRRLPATIRPLPGDLTDPSTLQRLPPDLEWVVYAAAAPARTDEDYRATYPGGLGHLVEALDSAGQNPSRLIFTSSTGVYGQDDGSWVDEASPTNPLGFTGIRMLEAEDVLHQAPWPTVSVRFGGIYGPGRTRLLRRVHAGDPIPLQPPRWTNRIHSDDCIGVIEHLLGVSDPEAAYVAVDDEPATLGEVIDFLCHRGGWPLPAELASAAQRRDTDRDDGTRGKRCRNRALGASGYSFRYPTFRQGYAELVDAFAQAPDPPSTLPRQLTTPLPRAPCR